jgi:very-short-patch-repair endonuclease
MGKGCPKCAKNSKLNTDLFIKKSEKKHNKKYEYHKVSYTTSTCPVIITCKKHGDFIQSPNSHLSGKGCSKCQQSHGERLISYELKKNKIVFETQKRFEGCFSLGKNNKVTKLPFDFYLPNLNICIEYDGRQHFMPVKRFGGVKRFLRVKKLDSIKDKFCVTNNIKLVRIPYTDKNNIESIIKNVLLS